MTDATRPSRAGSMFGTLGAAGVIWFALTFAAMHVIQPGLDPLHTLGSDYANGRLGWLMSLGFVMAGLGTLSTAIGLRRVFAGARRIGLATVFLVLAGLGFIGSGVFPTDVPLADGTVGYTFDGQMHAISGLVLFLSLLIAAFLIAGVFRREPGWRSEGRWTLAFAWTHLFGFLLSIFFIAVIGEQLGLDGFRQRIFVAIMLAWLIALGLWVRRGSPAQAPEPT